MSGPEGAVSMRELAGSLMSSELLKYAFQYGGFLLEAAVIMHVVRSGNFRRLAGPMVYVACILGVGTSRAYVIHHFGLKSSEYGYFYWTSDAALVLAAFAVVCVLFYRASAHEEKIWSFVRVTLVAVFLGVLAFSINSLLSHKDQLFTGFIVEFSQNVYFACLVLITLLYILMQQLGNTDDELGFLVCGMGIQFAGPAASLALFHLTSGEQMVRSLIGFIIPVCTLAMLVIWLYALKRQPQTAVDASLARGLVAWPEPAGDLKLRLR